MNTVPLLAVSTLFALTACTDTGDNPLAAIQLPPGFNITVYTAQTPGARSMAVGDDGTVYVGSNRHQVYAVRDANHDGQADSVQIIAAGLNVPNGVAFYQGDLYIGEINRISKLKAISQSLAQPPQPETVFEGYPKDPAHGAKYLRVGPDAKLYAGVGAPCNICLPAREIYASLTRLNTDGTQFEIYAKGIRNSVGFDWQPQTGALFFTDNGRDQLGDDIPPEELNRAEQPGLHFGYPYCHGGAILDPQFGQGKSCADYTAPAWKFPAHVAALGVHFYRGTQFPADYHNQLFVAQHGSWNRTVPQGYQVALVRFQDGKAVAYEVFASGWLAADGKASGRPVDVVELADGSLLVSDDLRGAIYRIQYQP